MVDKHAYKPQYHLVSLAESFSANPLHNTDIDCSAQKSDFASPDRIENFVSPSYSP